MVRLFPHQTTALDNLRSGSILCGGVGTGKSITALAYFYTKICDGEILENGSLQPPTRSVDLYIVTTPRKRDTLEWDEECTNFGLTRNERSSFGVYLAIDSWNNIAKYKNTSNAFFIFDEQRVVGNGQWVKSFLEIAKHNQWILLSATPGDTWSDYIPVFIANGFYRNVTDFRNQHIVYSRVARYPKIDRYINTGLLLRHRKDILVPMSFERSTVRVPYPVYTQYDKRKYDIVFRERWNYIEKRPVRDAGEACQLLRKVVNSDPSKITELAKILEEHPKAIIFYNYDYELEILRSFPYLVKAEYNGHRHDPLPEGSRWIYLVQYTSGCEGWNCTTTDTIIFFSQNYSYKVMEQASGRIDRMNTPYSTLYYYTLKSGSTIDCHISDALRKKKTFNEKAFMKM